MLGGMHELLLQRIHRNFSLWQDLAGHLPDAAFTARLPAPSNSIGAQFWCLVGARESYTRAIAAGSWQGFACSLGADDICSAAEILRALLGSEAAFTQMLQTIAWDDARLAILLDLLEHEVQHMGQLIRYCYGLDYGFPDSWKQRWSLG